MRPTASLFQRTDTTVPELQDSQTPERLGTQEHSHSDVQAPRVRSTLHLSLEAATALDAIQTAEMIRLGRRPERSVLVSRAIIELARNLGVQTPERLDSQKS